MINVYKTANGYMAQFVGNPDVVRAFGTDTIPTPFTSSADIITVMNTLKRGNPHEHVVFCPVSVPAN